MEKVIFWIQVLNLLLEMMTKSNMEVIKRKIERLIEVEDPMKMEGGGRWFLRIKVGIISVNPLIDGFRVLGKDRSRVWA